MEAWSGLDEPWRRALRLAWDAFSAGTVPVGAVVVDDGGALLAQGRNRIFESASPPGQLAGTRLAHAELNALAQLPLTRRYDTSSLYTTVEPCALCVGAASLATVGRILFAAPDVYSGGSGLVGVKLAVPRQLNLRIEGPLGGEIESLAEALHLAFFLEHRERGRALVEAYREQRRALFPLAEKLIGLRARTLEEALSTISAASGGG